MKALQKQLQAMRMTPLRAKVRDEPDGQDEEKGPDKVGKLPHKVGVGPHGGHFDEELDQLHPEAGGGTHGKQGDDGGDIAEVHFVKDGHQGDGELQGHEDPGHRRQKGGAGELFDGPFLLHNAFLQT